MVKITTFLIIGILYGYCSVFIFHKRNKPTSDRYELKWNIAIHSYHMIVSLAIIFVILFLTGTYNIFVLSDYYLTSASGLGYIPHFILFYIFTIMLLYLFIENLHIIKLFGLIIFAPFFLLSCPMILTAIALPVESNLPQIFTGGVVLGSIGGGVNFFYHRYLLNLIIKKFSEY